MMDIKRIAGDSRKEALVVLKAIPVKRRPAKVPPPEAPLQPEPPAPIVEEPLLAPAPPKSRAPRVRKTK